jgi:formylglycine-generating enzyme required for sulfatase activity
MAFSHSHPAPTSKSPPAKHTAWIPNRTFQMRSNDFYPEEHPVHAVAVDGFWMDEHPVTNAAFRRFTKATGYLTVAERQPNPSDYPGADPRLLAPGSLVFRQPPFRVRLGDPRSWWAYVPGARWDCPEGPGSTLPGRERHPVVHVAYEDAAGAWAGRALPTVAEAA